MPMIPENWAELLEPGLRKIFFLQVDALVAASRIPLLFNVQTSRKAQEHDLGIGGMADWDEFEGAIEFDEFDKGWKKTYTHVEFARGFQIKRSLVDDDQYNTINRQPRALALAAIRTREKHAASVFNNAFSSGYLGADSKALCAADHPYSPSNASTHGNAGSTALSHDAIISTRRLMREYVDDRGELVTVNPDTILIPAELEAEAIKALKSPGEPDTADRNINVAAQVGIQRVIVWDYLTDATNWFMIDGRLANLYLNWFDRVPLEFAMDPSSDFNLLAKYRGYMRYSYGWSDWRWVYGHEVAG